MEQIKERGELIVVTRNAATTYYEGPHGPTGLEYDLANLFAKRLGVELKIVVPENFSDILSMVEQGDADIAAAGLTITPERQRRVRFGPSYQTIMPQLIYRSGNNRPKSIDELSGILEVITGSSHEESLRALQKEHPELRWSSNPSLDSAELLQMVWSQLIDYTVADSNDVAIHQRFYPELRVAFDIGEPDKLAWAFMAGADDSLSQAAETFFEKLRASGQLKELLERHYGHVQDFDYVGTRSYMRHINQRLPDFIPLFESAAAETGLDWRLLAAVGYQESHWDIHAQSPTGVRGLMMLTHNTMKFLGLDDRLDPEQSIRGGARYIKINKDRLPDRISEPDRTWLALAAYNVGYGHLEDARVLTQKRGGNPDKWLDVKEALPLLAQKKWYKQTKYGYARGQEPVRYVENIRSYYDILVWDSERPPELVPSEPVFTTDLLSL
ncbi:MAG: membrane-bound lytic murein transglycosylase MltF [Gammaproteobacteria bacterium]|nr:membrane-bound lytic murein transglycosylase MltF [Gammaproteobacteria bacterium]